MEKLGTLQPIDGDRDKFSVDPANARTVVFENALSAPVYGAYGRRPDPTTADYDFIVPGSSLFAMPLVGGESQLQLVVKYPGAIPAGDAQLLCLVFVADCSWPPFVGAIA